MVSDFTPTPSIYGVPDSGGRTLAGTLISAISPENPDEAIKTSWRSSSNMREEISWASRRPEHGLPAYVLFNHPIHRSTLALRLDQNFNTEAMRNRLAECNRKYSNDERGPSDEANPMSSAPSQERFSSPSSIKQSLMSWRKERGERRGAMAAQHGFRYLGQTIRVSC